MMKEVSWRALTKTNQIVYWVVILMVVLEMESPALVIVEGSLTIGVDPDSMR